MNLQLSDYSYDLPDHRIARYPVSPRDSSKLLVYKNGEITHERFSNIHHFITEKSLLVFNDTKVIPARTHFQKQSGTIIEVFLLNPVSPTHFVHEAMLTTESCVWQCMIGNKKRWKNGEILEAKISSEQKISDGLDSIDNYQLSTINSLDITAELIDYEQNLVKFSWKNDTNESIIFLDVIQALGQIPLPPYLKRETEAQDLETYQTVYSKAEGAVAAPTAGLHFTENVFQNLAQKNIKHDFVTLHVGAGTFQPVKVENVIEHKMHSEQIVFTKSLIENLIENIGQIVAVGTTSMRSLESLYWIGVKMNKLQIEAKNIAQNDLKIEKLFPYEPQTLPTAKDSLIAILNYMNELNLAQLVAETEIFILPSYEFKICKGLITNYHQPESTLMLLVAAFVGNDWKKIYQEALTNDYRFLSYGDSSFLMP